MQIQYLDMPGKSNNHIEQMMTGCSHPSPFTRKSKNRMPAASAWAALAKSTPTKTASSFVENYCQKVPSCDSPRRLANSENNHMAQSRRIPHFVHHYPASSVATRIGLKIVGWASPNPASGQRPKGIPWANEICRDHVTNSFGPKLRWILGLTMQIGSVSTSMDRNANSRSEIWWNQMTPQIMCLPVKYPSNQAPPLRPTGCKRTST